MKLKAYQLNETESAVFDPDSLRIWKVPLEKTREILAFQGGLEELESGFGTPVNNPISRKPKKDEQETKFDTLVLHIANNCNLQCEYCYERHSENTAAPGNMTIETALDAVRCFYSRYSYIREIKFFGGEPALNQPVINAVCSYVAQSFVEGKIREKPVFKILTNGTIMNRGLIDLIKKYEIKVVFSIDGEAFIHDQLRVYPQKKGTFDTVYKNFVLLRKETGDRQPYSINATYTGLHEQAGITVNGLLWKLSDMFYVPPKKINVNLVAVDRTLPCSLKGENLMQKSAEDALLRAEKGDSRTHTSFKAVIRRLKNGGVPTESPCPAAVSWAAVSYTGNVYPCMMFTDRPDCYMGNVKDEIFELKEYREVRARFEGIRKSDHERCRGCIAKNVCTTCMGINEYESGRLYPRKAQSCSEYRKIVEAAVKGIAEGVW